MAIKPKTIAELLEDTSFVQWFLHNRPENAAVWEDYLEQYPGERPVVRQARRELAVIATALQEHSMEVSLERLNEQIDQPYKKQPRVTTFRPWRWVAAAAILFALFGGAYLFIINKPVQPVAGVSRFKNDVAPGSDKAVLITAQGQKIVLDSTAKGTVSKEGNTTVININGLLSYNTIHAGAAPAMLYNTVTTPKGGQYQLLLQDGTKVWLNAASSLRFPIAFTGKTREVELKGEGYFEVAKNAFKPFHVNVSGMQVEVLGTHFNVNAYEDETTVKTTLLEGAVKVTKGNAIAFLAPGNQAQLQLSGQISVTKDTDIEETMAWKDGMFRFSDADIETIMRQAARWYDVEVVYEGKVNSHFVANLPRNLPVSKLLTLLELTNRVHFKVEGKQITVMP